MLGTCLNKSLIFIQQNKNKNISFLTSHSDEEDSATHKSQQKIYLAGLVLVSAYATSGPPATFVIYFLIDGSQIMQYLL